MSQEQEVFVLAEKALQAVVNQIRDDQWDVPATTIPTMGGNNANLREIVNRHVHDDVWVPETVAGKTIAEVGNKYEGDLLGSDPKASFAHAVEAAVAAVEALTPADLNTVAHLTYGDFPVKEYLKHITAFRGFRAYTLAKFIGVDATLPDNLVQGLWDEVVPEVDGWRAMGVFGPAVGVPDDADQQTKLLGLTGFLQE